MAARIRKGHEQDHEQNGFAPKPPTPCFEFNCTLSPLASLCVVDTLFKLVNQNLVVTQVLGYNVDIAVMISVL